MRIEQVKDILEHTRHFHELISDYSQKLSEHTEKKRLKVILDYLFEHEQHLEKIFAEYEKCVSKKILNIWLPYNPCQTRLNEFISKLRTSEISITEIAKKIIEMDSYVIKMYKDLINEAENQDVKDIFYSILDFEKQEKRMAMKDLVWMEDV